MVKYPLQMASTLVDINQDCTCKVRILNPFPTAMSIKQDAVNGRAEPIADKPVVIVQQENNTESCNFVRVRRVDIRREESTLRFSEDIARTTHDGRVEKVPVHLMDLYEQATRNLKGSECQKVAKLLIQYQDSFSRDEWDLGLTHLTEHAIKTGDTPPIKQPPRRVPLAFAEAEKKAIEDLKAKGVIRDSVSPWASPIVLVSKKNGGVRPCMDYRKVNELVKPDGLPLPRILDCLDAVAGAT